jgi:hypothetical protein
MKRGTSSYKVILRLIWALVVCWTLIATNVHAAGQSCPYATIDPPMDVEINAHPPYCLYSRWNRLGYYWLLVIPITSTQSKFLTENIWTPNPPIKRGHWNEVSCGFYYPAKDFLILASGADEWFDLGTRVNILARRSGSHTNLKPFPIPGDDVWKQVQELSPGSKFDILSDEPDCTARELEGRKFVGSTFGDFNGDGKPDIVFNTLDPDKRHTLWIFHARDDGFDLIVRRKNYSAWVIASPKTNQKKEILVFAGGCDKGDPTYLEYDTKTGKYMANSYPYDENAAVPFESGANPE